MPSDPLTQSADAPSLVLRSMLIGQLADYIRRKQLTQAEAARVFGVSQPRVSDLVRGKVTLFGLDALVNMADSAGLKVELRVRDGG